MKKYNGWSNNATLKINLIEDYAKAFLKQVNYYEIAEAINTDMR